MNRYDRSLQASFWLMVVLQTIGSIDLPNSKNAPYKVARKLPAPKQYVAIVIVWATLHLLGDAGYGRPSAIAGWVMVLTGMVTGPFGKRFVGFVQDAANLYPTNPQANESQVPQASPSVLNG